MTWRYWLGFLVAFAALKWVMSHYGEEAGAYLVLGLLAAVLVIGYLIHAQKQHQEAMILQADPDERGRLLAHLPPARAAEMRFAMKSFEDVDLATAPPATEFSYPPATRTLTATLFWASAACAAGLLLPIIRGKVADQTTGAVLVAAALLFLVTAVGYRIGHRWAGVKLRVDAEGLTELGERGATHLPWTDLATVRYRRWAGAVDYESSTGQRIEVGTSLIDFAHFVQLTLIHRYRTSLPGAA